MSSRSISLLVDALAVLFGVGAWVSVNGIWVELPLMVDSLPEGWALPSYLSVIIQIANIGPVSYSALQALRPTKILSPFIYSLLAVGCVSSFLLVLFWDETTIIGNAEHSTALFILIFFLATVDCTSSVLYLPYMASWKSQYLPYYSVGEGLSGFLPAIVALAQGVGSSDDSDGGEVTVTTMKNISLLQETVNETSDNGPNFSVTIFFLILFFMMVASAVAFMLLNVLKSIQNERSLNYRHANMSILPTVTDNHGTSNENYRSSQPDVEKPPLTLDDIPVNEQIISDAQSSSLESTNSLLVDENGSFEWPLSTLSFLLFAQFFASFLTNGFLPSVQSYSCAPYGMTAYHLAATLSTFANPCAAFTTAMFPRAKISVVAALLSVGSIIAAYIIATAALSPSPPLVGTVAGSIIVVVSWVVFTYMLSFVRVEVNNLLRMTGGQKGGRVLFWSGASTQTGSFFGSLIAFVLVNVAGVFSGAN
ncbi:Solute carrier family 52 riboflavin transporter [Trinorchestia longiramus]|nr:Solute carrier family 52 riboflavin transporter [Trinorchestia longiramus]